MYISYSHFFQWVGHPTVHFSRQQIAEYHQRFKKCYSINLQQRKVYTMQMSSAHAVLPASRATPARLLFAGFLCSGTTAAARTRAENPKEESKGTATAARAKLFIWGGRRAGRWPAASGQRGGKLGLGRYRCRTCAAATPVTKLCQLLFSRGALRGPRAQDLPRQQPRQPLVHSALDLYKENQT